MSSNTSDQLVRTVRDICANSHNWHYTFNIALVERIRYCFYPFGPDVNKEILEILELL